MGQDAATPPGLLERIRDIVATEVSKLLRSGLLRNASITDGGLTVRGGFIKLIAKDAARETLYVGGVSPALPDGSLQPGFILRREDGTIAMALYDGSPAVDYKQFLALYDRAGNIIVGDDTDSGQGLARPWLPIPLYPGLNGTATTSGSFSALLIARAPRQQPRLYVGLLAGVPAGVTAEVRVMVNGTQVGSTATVNGGSTTVDVGIGPAAVPTGAYLGEMRIDVEARVVSGAGTVQLYPVRCEGRQS